ncbi:uncharacterized protein LOC118181612 isoform X2 [Stegodyphus dumicola]|nr:uncharacterized protein LOC118181612 isoform X2 [Stegodyphus dumicola]
MPYTTKFFCSKRMRPGQVCWNAPHNVSIEHDRYKVICPCVRYYECKFQNSFFPLKPVFAVSTCQPKPEESPEERNIYLREYEDRQRIIEYRRRYGDANRVQYFVG